MRLAVFTNQFPGRVNTFFARDIGPLVKAGVSVEIFPFYPYDASLWCYVPELLSENLLPRSNIHYVDLGPAVRSVARMPLGKLGRFFCDTAAIGFSAARFGIDPFAKTIYVALKALAWAQQSGTRYDHVLAYWGNYAATSAYMFRRLTQKHVPFSIFLHAGIDLYENPVYLRQKLLEADKIITCSDFNRNFIQQQFPAFYTAIADKIHLHVHGLDLTEFRYQPDNRLRGKILAVGGLFDYKGFDYLLRAAHELSLRGIPFEVELVGDGKEKSALESLAKQLGISEKVTFRGWIRPEEMPNVMRQATILVHPSSRLADGVPNVVKEAMAVGTPVIASSVAGLPELLGDGKYGMLVPPKDVRTLAGAIETLLSKDELRLRYACEARKHAERTFDVWRNGQRLANLFMS